MKDTNRRRMMNMCILLCVVYFASYITRKSYNASILTIIQNTSLTKAQTGLAVTGSFITYGLGQVINGFIGDFVRPRTMITLGLAGASICNILIPYSLSPIPLCILWCFNGFFQSMMWPSISRCMSEQFSMDFYKKGTTYVSVACSVATVAIYVIVSFFVEFFSWQSTFYFSAVLGAVVCVAWYIICGKYEKNPVCEPSEAHTKDVTEENSASQRPPFLRLALMSGVFPLMIVIALHGFLRDGIETWMSSFMNDVYGIDASGAILSVAILPVLSILSYSVGSFFQKKTGCPIRSNLVLWLFGAAFSLVLVLFYKNSALVGVSMIALLSGATHAINLMLTTRVSIYYKKEGYVSTFAGLLNACTYIGAAIATYGIAHISEIYSWTVIMSIFLGICVLGILFTLIALPKWTKFRKEHEE